MLLMIILGMIFVVGLMVFSALHPDGGEEAHKNRIRNELRQKRRAKIEAYWDKVRNDLT